MKINLIGMILNNCGRKCFDGAVLVVRLAAAHGVTPNA